MHQLPCSWIRLRLVQRCHITSYRTHNASVICELLVYDSTVVDEFLIYDIDVVYEFLMYDTCASMYCI